MVPIENAESDGADQRDTSLAKREAGLAARLETVVNILDAARMRDIDAEARDRVSSERDHAADLEAFLTPDVNNGYGADLPARRHAAQDRHDAKGDRASAADDRTVLSDVSESLEAPDEDGADESTAGPSSASAAAAPPTDPAGDS